MTGKRELKALEIDPEAVDPDDVEMLQDMIVAAVNEALRAAENDAASTMQKLTGGLGLPPVNFGGFLWETKEQKNPSVLKDSSFWQSF